MPTLKNTIGLRGEMDSLELQVALLNTNRVLLDQISQYISHMTEQNHKIRFLEHRIKDLKKENELLIFIILIFFIILVLVFLQ